MAAFAPSFSPEPVEGDSLTKTLRAGTNQAGTTGTNLINAGQQTFGQGTAGIGTAQGTASTAMGNLDPVVAYYKALLSGNPTATNTAISPATTALSTAYQQAIKNAQMYMPRGGARASAVQQLPFQQSQDIFNLIASLQPGAAQGLNQAVGTQAGIGGLQGQLAQALMSGGLGQTQVGSGLLGTSLQSMLARRGQNIQADALTNPLTNVLQGLAGIGTGVIGKGVSAGIGMIPGLGG